MTKEENQEFLELLITRYFSKSVKRRTINNTLSRITSVFNQVSQKYFEHKIWCDEETVLSAFLKSGFTQMDSVAGTKEEEEFVWNAPQLLLNAFINVKAQDIRDLRLACYSKNHVKWSDETCLRINELRAELHHLWKYHPVNRVKTE